MTGRNGDLLGPPDHVAYLLHMAMQRLRTEAPSLAADAGLPAGPPAGPPLRGSHLRLLDLIPPEGERVTGLALRARITKQGLGQLVAQLAELGYVEVGRDPSDRRAKVVWRTPRGDRVRRAARAAIAAVEGRWREEVGERRYEIFREVLEELVEGHPG